MLIDRHGLHSSLTIEQFTITIILSNLNFGKTTNVFKQKQEGYFAVYVRVPNGNISSDSSRSLIEKLRHVIADDVRVTINQGLQFRFVKPEHLEYVYSVLDE